MKSYFQGLITGIFLTASLILLMGQTTFDKQIKKQLRELEKLESEIETLGKSMSKTFNDNQLPKNNLNNDQALSIDNKFKRLSYTEAIKILLNSKANKKKKFSFQISGFGDELQSEHERYLVEKEFKRPVVITDYPKEIKAFYMRLNEDEKTVRAMDILFPEIGEIVGGSQREERLEILQKRMKEMNVDEKHLWWYLDTRKFGTCEHSGFGLGFERLVMFVTGMKNIRDVIPFPRTPKNAEF